MACNIHRRHLQLLSKMIVKSIEGICDCQRKPLQHLSKKAFAIAIEDFCNIHRRHLRLPSKISAAPTESICNCHERSLQHPSKKAFAIVIEDVCNIRRRRHLQLPSKMFATSVEEGICKCHRRCLQHLLKNFPHFIQQSTFQALRVMEHIDLHIFGSIAHAMK